MIKSKHKKGQNKWGNNKNIPKKPGVYYVKKGNETLYIGQTDTLHRRVGYLWNKNNVNLHPVGSAICKNEDTNTLIIEWEVISINDFRAARGKIIKQMFKIFLKAIRQLAAQIKEGRVLQEYEDSNGKLPKYNKKK